jgi:hypothetical protein
VYGPYSALEDQAEGTTTLFLNVVVLSFIFYFFVLIYVGSIGWFFCDKYFTVLGILGNLRGKLRRKMDEICSGNGYN